MLILFGTGKSIIRQDYYNDIVCPNCKQKCQHRITIEGVYFNLFFIPIFPLTRNIYSECEHCRVKLNEEGWSDSLKLKFQNGLQHNPAKRPIWHYFGCLSLLFVIALFIILIIYAVFIKDSTSYSQEDFIENIDDIESSIDNNITNYEDSIVPKIETIATEEIYETEEYVNTEEYDEVKPTDSIKSFF